jgi:hypothetical protein
MRNANASLAKPLTEPGILGWMFVAFCVALALAIATLAVFGANATGIIIAVRLTARFSFLLFFLAYVGGSAFALFGSKFAFLALHQRQFGLGFAAAHLVHIGLALWLYDISAQKPLSDFATIKFSIGAVCIYVLALYSVERIRKLINPRRWKFIRLVGINYIAYLFFADFTWPLRDGFQQPIAYLPFALLIVFGVALRIAGSTIPRIRRAWSSWGPREALGKRPTAYRWQVLKTTPHANTEN